MPTKDNRFLLAHLQMVLLCDQPSLRNVRRSLNKLPADLYAFYNVAMARIADQAEDRRIVVKKALCYLFCAKRPLNMGELLHALSIEAGDTELCEAALPDIQFLLGSSAGLIRADTQSGNMGLVHHTLQEYLKTHPGHLLSRPEMEMAKVCLDYLGLDEFQRGPCCDAEGLDRRLQKYRFFDYASHHWGSHFEKHQDVEPQHIELVQDFLRDDGKLSSSIQVLHMPRHRAKGWHDCFPKQVTPLHAAAYWGLDKVVTRLVVGEGVVINHQDSQGSTALHLAAQRGHVQVAQLLLEKAASTCINVVDSRGRTAVAWASRNGHEAMVKLLLAWGAETLRPDCEGWTALHWAVMGGSAELVEILLSHHANNASLGRLQRNRALILAAEAGSEAMIRMLLDDDDDNRTDVDWKDEQGSTALTFAIPLGHDKAVRALLEKGADVNAKDDHGNAPLHWAIAHPSITRLLLEMGADVDGRNGEGKTALHWAVQEGQEEAVKILVGSGGDVNLRDMNGFTALHAASLQGLEGTVGLLLENGADVDVKDEDGWTPLHAAALRRHDRIVSLLLKRMEEGGGRIVEEMAELMADDMIRALWDEKAEEKSAGSTVVGGIRSAANSGYAERVLALLEGGVDVDAEDTVGGSTALTVAASQGLQDIVQALLQHGADINKPDRRGWTALHHAAVVVGGLDLVKLLVENGADLEARVHGWTALLLAGNHWLPVTADYLIRQGAFVDAEDYCGRRVLHWAARNGSKTLAQLALDKGANVNAADRWGKTPLWWAAERREHGVAKLLLERGADTTIKARDGSTALHMAAFVGDKTLAGQLLAKGAASDAAALGGLTALHIASFMGYLSVAKLLLDRGADASDETRWSVQEYMYEGFDTTHEGGSDELLCTKVRRLLHEHGDTDITKQESWDSFDARQLATIGGSTTVLQLIARQRKRHI